MIPPGTKKTTGGAVEALVPKKGSCNLAYLLSPNITVPTLVMVEQEQNRQNDGSDGDKSMRETIAGRVRRHLRDISSEITEEDIRNARVESELPQHRYLYSIGDEFLKLYG